MCFPCRALQGVSQWSAPGCSWDDHLYPIIPLFLAIEMSSRFTPKQQLELYRECVEALDLVKEQMKTTKYLLQEEYDQPLLETFQMLHNLKRRMGEQLDNRIIKRSPNLLEEIIDVPSDSELKAIAEIIDVE